MVLLSASFFGPNMRAVTDPLRCGLVRCGAQTDARNSSVSDVPQLDDGTVLQGYMQKRVQVITAVDLPTVPEVEPVNAKQLKKMGLGAAKK